MLERPSYSIAPAVLGGPPGDRARDDDGLALEQPGGLSKTVHAGDDRVGARGVAGQLLLVLEAQPSWVGLSRFRVVGAEHQFGKSVH